ncbi:MAG: restriction endonuclease subunit S [ANME-2 cluster archaeon]|nr:restriction endonuclease subunit S [ANME-2 cluster archaeon]MBC2702127.1 restriction endonuclease subunit S [ANME-2 cluster archaeon]MBC2708712.1 restriction endonuclease subunit S [ANME-2 cluster archaeon]MBC2745418.1 restriction endonuclease subunit S [ANME-2 cluster archaeon]
MCEWKETKLQEIAVINPAERLTKGTKAKKVAMELLQPFTKKISTYSREEYKGGVKFRNGDTLVARITPSLENGKTSFVDLLEDDEVGFGSTEFIVLREIEGISDKNFLFYLACSPEFRDVAIASMTGSSGRQRVQTDVVKQHEFFSSPLPEQRAIASVLSSLDDKIDLLHRQNKTLEAMAETLFRQWFVEEAEEGWGATTLEQHIEVFRGLSYKGSGLTENGFGIPMHNLNSVYEGGGYKIEGIKFYSSEYKKRHLVYPGDIIVTNTEQGHEFKLIGFPAIVPDSFGDTGLFSQHIYKLVSKKKTDLSREFIYYLLMSHSVREQIISATNGSTVNMLAIDGLQRPEFKLPPKNKVIEFTGIVSAYWNKSNINNKQIHTLKKLRDTLSPKLMSGGVRVKLEQQEACI